jgi:hypothetical protein
LLENYGSRLCAFLVLREFVEVIDDSRLVK